MFQQAGVQQPKSQKSAGEIRDTKKATISQHNADNRPGMLINAIFIFVISLCLFCLN